MNYEQPSTSHPYAKGFSEDTVHREEVLEVHLCKALVEGQGYRPRRPEDYDRAAALDKALVIEFVKATQPDEWVKLEGHYGPSAETEFFKQLEQGLKQRGTLDVLRNGLKLVPNLKFFLAAFKPASGVNPDLVTLFERNTPDRPEPEGRGDGRAFPAPCQAGTGRSGQGYILSETLNDAHWADHNEQQDEDHNIPDDEWARIVARCAEAKLEASQRVGEVQAAYSALREAQECWIQSLRGQIAKLDLQIAAPR